MITTMGVSAAPQDISHRCVFAACAACALMVAVIEASEPLWQIETTDSASRW